MLHTLHSKEREVRTHGGGWRSVRIQPYRTVDNMIDGVVIAFVDIDRVKEAEEAAQQARLLCRKHRGDGARAPFSYSMENYGSLANRSFARFPARDSRSRSEQHLLHEVEGGRWNIPRLRNMLGEIFRRDASFRDFEVSHDFPRIGRRTLRLNALRLKQQEPGNEMILLAMEEVKKRPAAAGAEKTGVA